MPYKAVIAVPKHSGIALFQSMGTALQQTARNAAAVEFLTGFAFLGRWEGRAVLLLSEGSSFISISYSCSSQ
jgi:hypothetical protein